MARRAAAEPKEEELSPLHPKLAEQLIAHADAEKQLLAMFNAKRMPHALLITGQHGVGKATLAWRLARFLLAPQESGGGLFGESPPPDSLHIPATHSTFRRMVAGSHPDFLVLEAEDIKVEEARSVAAFLSLTPAESEWRVVIIDSADAMNRNAANALLKTLEEPPPRAMLLLISHNPGSLLPTIRSRCRLLRLPPLSQEEFASVMVGIVPDLTPQQMHVWSLLSGGSPGVALTLIEAKADILYRELLERIATPDTLKSHAFADRFARKEAVTGWYTLSRLFMWMLARITGNPAGVEAYSGEHEALARLRARKPLESWLELWERIGKLLSDTEHLHLDKKQAILTLLKAAGE